MMKLVKREPGVGYFDSWLWLPKTHVSEMQIHAALTYVTEREKDAIAAWREEPHHFRVPRNYLTLQTLNQLRFPIYDTRFRNFPTVDLRSRVVLDAREPSKTYQREGSEALLDTHDGILCLRCGAGKTVVALHSAAQLKQPILIAVTDKGLARQWMEEIEQFLGVPQNEIGRVGGDGGKFDWEHPITVALVQTLANRVAEGTLPVEMTRHFGVIIPDEAHLMGAPYFNTAIPPFHGRRWGLSATPSRDDGFDSLLRYTIGPTVYSYLTPDLKPTVFFKRLPTKLNLTNKAVFDATHDCTKNLHFGKLYTHFATLPTRTDEMVKDVRDAVREGRQVLILTHSRAMCEELGQRLPDAGLCHAGVKEEERIRRIRECNPVIAIMQLGKQALNKPKLDTLFVCEPFTKKGALQQTMGRVLRSFAGKKAPIVVFFEDVYIRPLMLMCNKLRQALVRWPSHKGGAIMFKIIKAKE
jgi:superfamily II DNA or RNA helicase